MPTYSYACTECDNKFDVVQAFSDDALTECPKCDGRLRKLFGKVGVVFKGSGFYRNDSREAAKSASNGSSKSTESAASSSSDSSSSSGSTDKKSDSTKSDRPLQLQLVIQQHEFVDVPRRSLQLTWRSYPQPGVTARTRGFALHSVATWGNHSIRRRAAGWSTNGGRTGRAP